MERGNLFVHAAAPDGAERVDELLRRGGARVERIVSCGHAGAPGEWYDQPGDEWVALLAGTALLELASGERIALAPGDWLLLPAHARHRVAATSAEPPCVWLAVHLPPAT